MKTKIISKLALLVTVAFFVNQAGAEYYYGCSTPCCGSPCGKTVKYRVAAQQIYSPPVKKVKYYERKTRSLGGYNMVVYYVWPTYVGTVVAPVCGGGCVQPVVTYCDAPSCQSFYAPPEYYTTVSNDNVMDQGTADDFSSY